MLLHISRALRSAIPLILVLERVLLNKLMGRQCLFQTSIEALGLAVTSC
jgi:hypothetical protein